MRKGRKKEEGRGKREEGNWVGEKKA